MAEIFEFKNAFERNESLKEKKREMTIQFLLDILEFIEMLETESSELDTDEILSKVIFLMKISEEKIEEIKNL